jgi:DNA-binding response OmpR family regulator
MNRRNILIFDPERDMADLLTRAIESHLDSKCYLATREEECLALLKDIPFDFALLDFYAIYTNEFRLLRKIKQEYPCVTLIIQSYLHQHEQAQAAKKYGVDDLLIKPLPVRSLREKLKTIFNQSSPVCHRKDDSTVSD